MSELAQKGEAMYLTIIGDIRQSRSVPDRRSVQGGLEAALTALNQEFGSELAAPFAVAGGDEFQGLLLRPDRALRVINTVESWLSGLRLRYGLGWGALATSLRPEVIRMDGPCFHAARDALTRGKAEDRWVTVGGFGPDPDQVLNGIFRLMDGVRRRWKPKQAETVGLMRRARLQKEVAATRGVVESVVSDTLRSALYAPLREAERAVEILLADLGRPDHPDDDFLPKSERA